MARARGIKPGFYLNDQLAECSVMARFIFPGLWMLADRAGRLEDRPLRIKAAILPYDNADIHKLLSELHDAGMIIRYEIYNHKYIQVVNFEKHQNPHVREPESIIPAPDQHCAGTVPAPDQHQTSTGPARLTPDSLTPDSLTPDSLTPDSLTPDSLTPDSWKVKVKNKHAPAREATTPKPGEPLFAPPVGGCVVSSPPSNPVLVEAPEPVTSEAVVVDPITGGELSMDGLTNSVATSGSPDTKPEDAASENVTSTKPAKPTKPPKAGIHHRDAISILLSHDVPQSVIDDYLTLRTNRKAALTPTAVKIFLTEVNKSGWTPEQAMSECCVRGWTGFKAEWVANLANPTQPHSPARPLNRQESLEARNRKIGEQVAAEVIREMHERQQTEFNQSQPKD